MDKYYEQTGYIGAEEPRCYYVPFASRDEWSEKREDSGEFLSLNGSWKIRAYDCPAQAEQDSFLDKVPEQDISVPSCVQYYEQKSDVSLQPVFRNGEKRQTVYGVRGSRQLFLSLP